MVHCGPVQPVPVGRRALALAMSSHDIASSVAPLATECRPECLLAAQRGSTGGVAVDVRCRVADRAGDEARQVCSGISARNCPTASRWVSSCAPLALGCRPTSLPTARTRISGRGGGSTSCRTSRIWRRPAHMPRRLGKELPDELAFSVERRPVGAVASGVRSARVPIPISKCLVSPAGSRRTTWLGADFRPIPQGFAMSASSPSASDLAPRRILSMAPGACLPTGRPAGPRSTIWHRDAA